MKGYNGEWALPKFRAGLINADSNHDGAVLMSEVQDALSANKITVSVPLLDSYFRSLRPRVGAVPIDDFLRPFQGCAVWCGLWAVL